ncbi:MAG: ABC transporter permease [bacterium]
MNLWESIGVAFEGIAANKVRAFLTMLGVIIGVGAVIVIFAITQGARQQTLQQIQQMGSNVLFIMPGQQRAGGIAQGAGTNQSLTLDDCDAIAKNCPSVLHVAPQVSQNYQIKYLNQNTNTGVTGATPEFLDVRNYSVSEGDFFTETDLKMRKTVATIGPTTAKNLFGDVSPIGKNIAIKGIQFTIIGLMTEKGSAGGFGDPDDQVYVPITTAMRRLMGVTRLRQISVQAVSLELMNQAISEIDTVFAKSHLTPSGDKNYTIRNQADIIAAVGAQNDTLTMLLASTAIVSLLVGGIGIMNIMLVSVTERTREIGIRMAVGARGIDILLQFLVEALVLSLMGGMIGILVGVGVSWAFGRLSGWTLQLDPVPILMSFGFAAFVGLVFGVWPAFKAAALDPIDALRYE